MQGFATCNLCEAMCGLRVEIEDGRVTSIRGDDDDPLSRGHICPKAAALGDLSTDPDRVTTPLRRNGDSFEEVGWDEALDDIADRLSAIAREHGNSAVGVYVGHPTTNSDGALLYGPVLLAALKTRNFYSSNSVDARPRLMTSWAMYGSQLMVPIPDIDHTDHMVIIGANPAVSNGSLMTAPGCAGRLKAIRARGGKVVVIDPRRNETAKLADEHHFIRPGADAALLAAVLQTLCSEGLTSFALAEISDGFDELRDAVSAFTPEAVAARTGMAPDAIRRIAREMAAAKSAVIYGRLGTCTQRFGGLTTWLLDCINIATGNFDRTGGAMFASPALEVPVWLRRGSVNGTHDRFRSRVRGLPEFGGELPVVALAEEMDTPGDGQIRGFVTLAGNPVLSAPGGRRLEKALGNLDFMVSIDIYRNETTRFANYILPAATGLERDHYGAVFSSLAVRNHAKFSPALLTPPGKVRQDWEILADLATRLWSRRGFAGKIGAFVARRVLAGGPRQMLDRGLRFGPRRLRLRDLELQPHGVDFGPLEPRLPAFVKASKRRVQLAPALFTADIHRLKSTLDQESNAGLVLIGRRTLRSNNSWMHNLPRLMRGRTRCTLLMYPADAERLALVDGSTVRVVSASGAVEVPLEWSDELMRGVVSLPHGFGHGRSGAVLQTAAVNAGVSANDVTSDVAFDPVSGCGALNETPVTVEAV